MTLTITEVENLFKRRLEKLKEQKDNLRKDNSRSLDDRLLMSTRIGWAEVELAKMLIVLKLENEIKLDQMADTLNPEMDERNELAKELGDD